jgi:hypothetical protein
MSARPDITGVGGLRWPPSCGSPQSPQYSIRMRLDEDKLEALRHWGEALRQSDGEERSAAGRAVLMLIEEIERLRLELRRAGEQMNAAGHTEELEEPSSTPSSTLQQRLHRVLGRESAPLSDSVPEPVEYDESDIGSDEMKTSPQAWIESLRRQT